ncbi:hypothetical protein ACQEU5_20850 [Marinactinospora thermotolerans]|uniref:Uncharacterized protein n=1 Tax=Marinactinospora thermotolerans DSM 45154 TaxID=1122192 RepID=A0A1T4PN18_9ACTN|nr:hypothetical protein [Marinactinospora thermotolerans]SJZ92912.1 hypothetical protein SAMN02745673_01897 [Marinactinospora thermotolerans DSM 45154]
MRKVIEAAGFVLVLMGISGTIDHLAVQPFLGFLNVFNRLVVPRVEVLADHALYANLGLALLGAVVMVLGGRAGR